MNEAEAHETARQLTDRAFPHLVGIQSTHYEGCYRSHPACAYYQAVLATIDALEEGITLAYPTTREIHVQLPPVNLGG